MVKKYLFITIIMLLLLLTDLNCFLFNKKQLVNDKFRINEFANYFSESFKPEVKLITEKKFNELEKNDSLFIISGTELYFNSKPKIRPIPYSFIRTELFIINYTYDTDVWYLNIMDIDRANILTFQIEVLERKIPYRIDLVYYFSERKLPSGKYYVILNNTKRYSESEIMWINTKYLKFKKF